MMRLMSVLTGLRVSGPELRTATKSNHKIKLCVKMLYLLDINKLCA